jgi:hypothetical protein
MNAQEAVDAGRFYHQWLPDEITCERLALPLKYFVPTPELKRQGNDAAPRWSSSFFLFRSGALRGAAGFTFFDREIHGAARRNQNRAGRTSRAEARRRGDTDGKKLLCDFATLRLCV